MPLSSRVIPRDRLGPASPFRMDKLADASSPAGKADAAQALQKARDKAYQEGLAAGLAAGRAEAARERIVLRAILEGHERELARLDDGLAGALLALAADLARHIVRGHVAVREDAVLPVVREALALVREDATPLRLALAPAEAALVERELGAELAQRGCRVVPDPEMEAGGCRIEGPHAQVDASLATRWRKALAPLGESRDWID